MQIGKQELSSPDGAIRTISYTIEGYPHNRPSNIILHHTANNVCMMVLHRNEP